MKLRKAFSWAICLTCLLSASCGDTSRQCISVEDFGARPNDGENDFEALRKATAYCREHPGTTLFFPPGRYDIDNEKAREIEYKAISGAYGENVQGVLFKPDAPYVTALDLRDCDNTTVLAHGATLHLHGWYEVITLQGARDVNVEGISILYDRPPATIGRIVTSNRDWFDAEFDTLRYRFIDKTVTGRLHFFDTKRNRLYMGQVTKKELLGPGRIRFHSTTAPAPGDWFVLRHSGHYRPAIMIKECEHITIRDVKIHSQPGMGIVGHLTKDILIDNLQVIPEPGSVISTNTDATHFTSCSGTVTLQNSKFKGQGDDCTNIHGYYYKMYPDANNKIEIRIEEADLHALSLDYPQIGDTMAVIDKQNMSEQGRYAVRSVDTSSMAWKVVIELDRPVDPDAFEKCYMWNRTRFPKVRILNNSVHSHLARSFLVKSRDVVIAGNCILNSTITAIKLGAELSWRESGPAENVLVEKNYITGCGYAMDDSVPSCITLSTEAQELPPCLNRNIVIRNNVFDTEKPIAVLLKDAENVVVANNTTGKKNYVTTENCRNVKVIE